MEPLKKRTFRTKVVGTDFSPNAEDEMKPFFSVFVLRLSLILNVQDNFENRVLGIFLLFPFQHKIIQFRLDSRKSKHLKFI